MIIVNEGVPFYDISISENANECVRFASEELRDFIKKCTGAELKIISRAENSDKPFISVGNTEEYKKLGFKFDFSTLNGDGFFIKTFGKNVYINAQCDRGVLFGVYDFIERFLGVRFVAKDTTFLP